MLFLQELCKEGITLNAERGQGTLNAELARELLLKLITICENKEFELIRSENLKKRSWKKISLNVIKFYKFPSITQFKDVVKNIKYHCDKWNIPLPTLEFQGTVKLHGTHGDVIYNNGKIYCQSRNKLLTLDDDNMGFAKFIKTNELVVKELFNELKLLYPNQIYILHGEWCGGNIQKNVALTQLERMFIIYKCSIYENQNFKTLNTIEDKIMKKMVSEKHNIYNIFMFPVYYIDIDFENPQLIQNKLIELTDKVEKECPVGKYFGKSGIGEGIVWTCRQKNYHSSDFVFKVKGEQHAVTKVKTLLPVDSEKIKNINVFITNTLTENRLQQGIEYLNEFKIPLIKSSPALNQFSNWVLSDIIKEESDLIQSNNFNIKEITRIIKTKASKWYITNL
jgi:hypothetical protein